MKINLEHNIIFRINFLQLNNFCAIPVFQHPFSIIICFTLSRLKSHNTISMNRRIVRILLYLPYENNKIDYVLVHNRTDSVWVHFSKHIFFNI